MHIDYGEFGEHMKKKHTIDVVDLYSLGHELSTFYWSHDIANPTHEGIGRLYHGLSVCIFVDLNEYASS